MCDGGDDEGGMNQQSAVEKQLSEKDADLLCKMVPFKFEY